MTQVFHGHQPRIMSRHHGKEQMLSGAGRTISWQWLGEPLGVQAAAALRPVG